MEFGVVAIPRLLKLLRELSVKSSFCIPGHTACAFPDHVKLIRDDGHEIVHHGWVHENPADFDRAGEKRILERGLEALDRVAGESDRLDIVRQLGTLARPASNC